jgi:hypothetical protein
MRSGPLTRFQVLLSVAGKEFQRLEIETKANVDVAATNRNIEVIGKTNFGKISVQTKWLPLIIPPSETVGRYSPLVNHFIAE